MGQFSLSQESLNSIPEADVAALLHPAHWDHWIPADSIPAPPVPTPFKQQSCLYILHCQGLSTITDRTSERL